MNAQESDLQRATCANHAKAESTTGDISLYADCTVAETNWKAQAEGNLVAQDLPAFSDSLVLLNVTATAKIKPKEESQAPSNKGKKSDAMMV